MKKNDFDKVHAFLLDVYLSTKKPTKISLGKLCVKHKLGKAYSKVLVDKKLVRSLGKEGMLNIYQWNTIRPNIEMVSKLIEEFTRYNKQHNFARESVTQNELKTRKKKEQTSEDASLIDNEQSKLNLDDENLFEKKAEDLHLKSVDITDVEIITKIEYNAFISQIEKLKKDNDYLNNALKELSEMGLKNMELVEERKLLLEENEKLKKEMTDLKAEPVKQEVHNHLTGWGKKSVFVEKACKNCGDTFETNHKLMQYCSDLCKNEYNNRKKKEPKELEKSKISKEFSLLWGLIKLRR